MFNPNIQYRCDIIRGKAQRELDNLLPAYANIIAEICPVPKDDFKNYIRDKLSNNIFKNQYDQLNSSNKKTIDNHRTEIAGQLFGLFFLKDNIVYESESNKKLLEDNDQPAFFKNLCLNFQFPNGTQAIQTIVERIDNNINFKPFHFIIALISLAVKRELHLTKNEIGYYVLNAKEVLQGIISVEEVLDTILKDRVNNCNNKVPSGSKHTQHIREQLNLLSLANLIFIENDLIILNQAEINTIEIFITELKTPLRFNIYKYDLSIDAEKRRMYSEWSEYYGEIAVNDYDLISTSVESLQRVVVEKVVITKKGTNHKILGDEGEDYVFDLEKNRVNGTHPRLTNKVLLLGNQRGLGYDISSVEANENFEEPEFARFIEVKSTKRITEPDLKDDNWIDTINLTRKEWIAAKQYRTAYNIYRVYFTPTATIVRKINDPFTKNENNIISVLPTLYRMDFNSKSIDNQY